MFTAHIVFNNFLIQFFNNFEADRPTLHCMTPMLQTCNSPFAGKREGSRGELSSYVFHPSMMKFPAFSFVRSQNLTNFAASSTRNEKTS